MCVKDYPDAVLFMTKDGLCEPCDGGEGSALVVVCAMIVILFGAGATYWVRSTTADATVTLEKKTLRKALTRGNTFGGLDKIANRLENRNDDD